MEAKSTDKKTFQLTENGQSLGELIYENLFLMKAEIRLGIDGIYQIKPVGFVLGVYAVNYFIASMSGANAGLA